MCYHVHMTEEQRVFVFSDIHGCLDELKELVEVAEVRDQDKLIFNGDIIDKGPDTPGVVRYIRELPNPKVLVLGNHEERFLRWVRYECDVNTSANRNPMKHIPEEFSENMKRMNWDDVRFLDSAVLTHSFEVGDRSYICTHAGIPPWAKSIPDRSAKRKIQNPWLRIRNVSKEGKFVILGSESETDTYWAHMYDGRFGICIFGHQPFLEGCPFCLFKYAIPLDGGCVHGGNLWCLKIEPTGGGGVQELLYEVPAKKKYAEVYKPKKKSL